MREHGAQREHEIELAKAQAYWTAALSRARDLPHFATWLGNVKPGRELAGEEAERREQEHREFATRVDDSMKHEGDGDG